MQSDELKARLDKLREMQERKEYAELVRDVAPPAKEDRPELFSSYKDQIGFGTIIFVPRSSYSHDIAINNFLY